MSLHPILFVFLLFLSLALVLRKRARGGNLRLPPSPPKLPIIGNLHQIGTLPHRSFQALSKKYGPIMLLHLGSVPSLVVSSPEIVKEMLKTHDIIFSNRARPMSVDIILNGQEDLAFSPYGEYWRQLRKLCVQELLSVHRVQSLQFQRDEEVDRLVKKIRRSSLQGETVNLSELLLDVTNDMVCRAVIGERCEGEDGKSKWGEMSRKILLAFPAFSFKDYFPNLGWMDNLTGFTGALTRTSKEVDAFFEQVIEKRRVLLTDGSLSSKRNFIDILLHLKETGLHGFDLSYGRIKAILLVSLSLSLSLYLTHTYLNACVHSRVYLRMRMQLFTIFSTASVKCKYHFYTCFFLHSYPHHVFTTEPV
jgi:cytochrome P450